MRRRERQMVRRMPVLGQHDVLKALSETIDQRNDLVSARHGQASPRAEVILNVDDD